MTMGCPLLQLTGMTRRFPSEGRDIVVLKHIDLTIDAGEIVAIVGVSGSGKSTLMNILGCLDRPSEGSYRVGGRETQDLDGDELAQLRRERFGFIFQRYHLLPHLNATENVQVPAVYAGVPQTARRDRAAQLLARLGLADRVSHRPNQLSGGQQQRVSIARALMNGGDVILADEPTGALDTASGREVIRILRELNGLGHTVIIVTHDAHVAAHANRIIEIRDGEIVADVANEPPRDDAQGSGASVASYAADPLPRDDAQGSEASVALYAADPLSNARARRAVSPKLDPWPDSIGRCAEAFRMAWFALTSHKLRTLLMLLGIVIGIASVVSIVAIGEGAKRYTLDEIASIGTNTIGIYPGFDWGDPDASAIQTLIPSDMATLTEQPYVDSATPETSRSLLVRYRNVSVNALVNGVGDSYFRVTGMKFSEGIGFGADETRRQALVAVIDQNARRKLFSTDSNPLGNIILVDNLPCIVIGVVRDKRSAFGDANKLNVWVPYTTASGRLFGQHHLDSITVRVRDGQPSHIAEKSLVALMTRLHGRKDFFTYNVDSVIKTVERTGKTLTLLLSLIGVISLVVGGIGVMNIMLVSVTERTREIGIRVAVGARQGDVMLQFLVEAVIVCLAGGLIGIALSFGLGFVFPLLDTQWTMVFSANAIVSAFLCSTLIGVAFGFLPARNAARLDPNEALARD